MTINATGAQLTMAATVQIAARIAIGQGSVSLLGSAMSGSHRAACAFSNWPAPIVKEGPLRATFIHCNWFGAKLGCGRMATGNLAAKG